MGPHILESGKKIRSMVLAFTLGWTEDLTRVNGLRTIWKALASILGAMAGTTKANTLTIRSMGMVYIVGKTQENTQAIGKMENNMDLVNT